MPRKCDYPAFDFNLGGSTQDALNAAQDKGQNFCIRTYATGQCGLISSCHQLAQSLQHHDNGPHSVMVARIALPGYLLIGKPNHHSSGLGIVLMGKKRTRSTLRVSHRCPSTWSASDQVFLLSPLRSGSKVS